ncbi:LysR family transcriptional regulator [Roseiconus lacunae]|uniref:LysR family transcriptional regulator n=1 Tax=Roseiconus lacunae TaxID=2605694 RepID=UPI0011F3990A
MMPQFDATKLTVQQMQTFCEVYRCGSYAEAARRLDTTSTTLWEQIRVLQRTYQATLFDRRGKKIVATPAAETLYKHLAPMLESIHSSFVCLHEQESGEPKEIRIVVGVRMMLEELDGPLQAFVRSYPSIRLRLMTADNQTAQQMVVENQADLALMIEPFREARLDGITIRRLYEIEYLAVISRRNSLSKRNRLTIKDLLRQPLVLGHPQTIVRREFNQWMVRSGCETEPQIRAETDNSAATIACVRAGLGVGIVAGLPSGWLVKSLTTKSLAKEMGKVYVVACTRTGYRAPDSIAGLLQTLSLIDQHGSI